MSPNTKFLLAAALASSTFTVTSQAEPLEDIVARSLKFHPTIQGTKADRMIGDGRIKEAKTGYNPTVTLESGVDYKFLRTQSQYEKKLANPEPVPVAEGETAPPPEIIPEEPRWTSGIYLSIRQMIFDGGLTASNVKTAKLERQLVEFNVATAEINVALQAVNDYFEVLSLIEQERAVRAAIGGIQQLVTAIQPRASLCKRRHLPLTPEEETQCKTAQINFPYACKRDAQPTYDEDIQCNRVVGDEIWGRERVAALVGESQRLQNEFRDAYARLLRNSGQPVPPTLRARNVNVFELAKGFSMPKRNPDMPNSAEEAMARAEQNNPLVKMARLNQSIAQETRRGADIARWSPRLEAVGTIARIDPHSAERSYNEGYVGIRGSIQLYDAGLASAKKMQAAGQYIKARAEEKDAILTTQNAIDRMYNYRLNVRERIHYLNQRTTKQEQILAIRWKSYFEGDPNIFLSELTAAIEDISALRTERSILATRDAYTNYDVHGSMGTLLQQMRVSAINAK